MIISASTIVVGSGDLQTSVAGEEILGIGLINFNILNDQDCHMKINNKEYIFVRANQGLAVDVIHSLRIEESGITFNWIGVER